MRLIYLLAFVLAHPVSALEIDSRVKADYFAAGGSEHSMSHLDCFMQNFDRSVFKVKKATSITNRCNVVEGGSRRLSIGNFDKAVIVDYTKPSTSPRLFILDLSMRNPNSVKTYFVSHGRYGNTSRSNTKPGPRSNTIKEIKHYSNVKGSNATSSGFAISGFKYRGRWSGPQKNKNSLVIHGIEKGINDNACDRAVVLHGNGYIRESGPNRGVGRMSSGCYMLDYNHVNQVVEQIRGGGGPLESGEARSGGVVFLTYGSREASLPADYYCQSRARDGLLLD